MTSRLGIGIVATLLCACGSSAAHSAGAVSTTGAGSSTVAGSTTGAGSSTATSSTATSAPGATVPPCGPAGAHTLAASRRARVYASGGRVFACAAGSHRRWVLGSSTGCLGHPLAGPAAVNGVLAAYATESCGIDTGSASVHVRRLTDGKFLAQVRATATPLGPESHVMVTALVLAHDGSAAWISAGGSIVGTRTVVEVHALVRGAVSRLDTGAGINRTALELIGSRLRWRHSGRWRAATLG